jgi:hypothetical protein
MSAGEEHINSSRRSHITWHNLSCKQQRATQPAAHLSASQAAAPGAEIMAPGSKQLLQAKSLKHSPNQQHHQQKQRQQQLLLQRLARCAAAAGLHLKTSLQK